MIKRHTDSDVNRALQEGPLPYRDRACAKAVMVAVKAAARPDGSVKGGVMFASSSDLHLLGVGLRMEDTAQLLRTANAEVQESKRLLETVMNEVTALAHVVQPALAKHVLDIRSSRMAVVTELRESLAVLREVRKFFLESDYQEEMARLERFVSVCRQLQELKQTGVLDAVAETAIRLGLKEVP